MKPGGTSKVVNLLLDTLASVEKRVGSHPNDTAMKNLKLNICRLVAEFETAKSRQCAETGDCQ